AANLFESSPWAGERGVNCRRTRGRGSPAWSCHPMNPPHPNPLPRKRHGGEGELALRLPAILPLPRPLRGRDSAASLGGEGRGEGLIWWALKIVVAVSRWVLLKGSLAREI